TVGLPETTWSLIPSFGYAYVLGSPNSRSVFVSLSQESSSGSPSPTRTVDPLRQLCPTTRSPWAESDGRGCSAYPHDQVLRYQYVGRTGMVASSGAAFSTVTRMSRSCGPSFA